MRIIMYAAVCGETTTQKTQITTTRRGKEKEGEKGKKSARMREHEHEGKKKDVKQKSLVV